MNPAGRWVSLTCVARVRSAGSLPWLLAVAWIVFAAAQEPLLLRTYGIRILDQGAWAAGAVLLLVYLPGEPGSRSRPGWGIAANVGLVAVLGVAQAGMAALAEVATTRSCDVATHLGSAANFVATWLGLAVIVSTITASQVLERLLILVQTLFAITISTRLWAAGWSLSTAIALVGCVLAAAATRFIYATSKS